ncbi:unnamed protein product, partial [Meganyctiphanes norvegica]
CCQALGSKDHTHESDFLKFKDRGGLFKPTQSVIKICQETEKKTQRMLNRTGGNLPHGRGVPDAIATAVLTGLGHSSVFSELNDHALETPVGEEYHIFAMIKIIAKCYCRVRFYHLAKQETDKITGEKIRKRNNKLTLWGGQ